jgi:large subunit ribosomal protein L25
MTKTKSTKKIESNKLSIKVEERKVFGKKLKKIRKEGLIPANIYGVDFKSKSISVNFKDFLKIYKIAKETGIVYLHFRDEEIPVLIRNIQRHPVGDTILHVDFRKINLTQNIKTKVPVKLVGQSEAVSQKGGVLLAQMDELMIESLPQNIPPAIEVDISVLKEIGSEIKVSDLTKATNYKILEEPGKVIVSVIEHKEESIVPETAPAAAPEVITEAGKTEETAQTKETPPKTGAPAVDQEKNSGEKTSQK